MKKHALIVDDEPDIRELLALTLSRMDIPCTTAATVTEARQALANNSFDLCLTDMRLPDGLGVDLVKLVQQDYPGLPIAIITAYGSMQTAIDALKAGAFDFISKPVELDHLRRLVKHALDLSPYDESESDKADTEALIGESDAIKEVRHMIQRVSRTQAPIFVSGESGTGKELVARLIHNHSARSSKAFIAVNCGAIPAELMESEFFGHTKGSFTGATHDKEGLFQAADGGTLFLDEVADLPMSMQVKLLRVIQEGAVKPIGRQQETAVDVRILSATNKDLLSLTEGNRFRNDLYFRLNVIELSLPPLRERPGDIKDIAKHILELKAEAVAGQQKQLSSDAVQTLAKHSFPGNVRELENILERAIALSDSHIISSEDLQLTTNSTTNNLASNKPHENDRENMPLEKYLQTIEAREIKAALDNCNGNQTEAASQLGMSPRQLRYRISKLDIRK